MQYRLLISLDQRADLHVIVRKRAVNQVEC